MKIKYKITYTPPERLGTNLYFRTSSVSERGAKARFYREHSKRCVIVKIEKLN